MTQSFATPRELVQGLQNRDPMARQQFWQLLREPTEKLINQLIQQNNLPGNSKYLSTNALHAAETFLRSQPEEQHRGATWPAFRAMLLVQLARLLRIPHGVTATNGHSRTALPFPETPFYRYATFSRPYSQIGTQFFGGDWYVGRHNADGSLWVFLADVTGHGYFAYLLATALPAVWQNCWAAYPQTLPQPAELLGRMHELLADSLPEGIFLEATLVTLRPEGETVVLPAGATRFVLRCRGQSPEVIKLRGAWLGLSPPNPDHALRLRLDEGDELLLVTDGVFDQLDDAGGLEALRREWRSGTTFDLVQRLLEQALARGPQKDDITVVWLERQASQVQGGIAHYPGATHV
jgi:hypothetical protein